MLRECLRLIKAMSAGSVLVIIAFNHYIYYYHRRHLLPFQRRLCKKSFRKKAFCSNFNLLESFPQPSASLNRFVRAAKADFFRFFLLLV